MRKPKRTRSDSADAFLPESSLETGTADDLAELLAEQYLRSAVGDEPEEDTRDEIVPEELGGPFVESGPDAEFGPTRADRPTAAELAAAMSDFNGTPPFRSALPQAVGPLAIAGLDEDAVDLELDEDLDDELNAAGLPGSDPRAVEPGSEPASRVEPEIPIGAVSSRASRT